MKSVLPLITTEGLLGLKTIPCSVRGGGLGGSGWAATAPLVPTTSGVVATAFVLGANPAGPSEDELGLVNVAAPGAAATLGAPGPDGIAVAKFGLALADKAGLPG